MNKEISILERTDAIQNTSQMIGAHARNNATANRKDVVVTGVSSGIGLGTTKALISKGFRVFGSIRKKTDADRLQREFGNGFVSLTMDSMDADTLHQVAILPTRILDAYLAKQMGLKKQ